MAQPLAKLTRDTPPTPGFERTNHAGTIARIGVEQPLVLHTRVVTGSGGGPDKTIIRSARHADQNRVRMAAAYIHPEGDDGIQLLRHQAAQWGCPFYTLPERGALDRQTFHRMLDICKQQNVAVWHGHDYKSNAMGLLLRRFHPMKLVTTVHGWTNETWRTRMYYHVDMWSIKRYDQVVTVSADLYDHCIKHGIDRKKLWSIPNAIQLDEYQRQNSTDKAKQHLNINANTTTLGVVSRLSKEKGVDRAIRAIAALLPKYADIELHIIGDGPEFAALNQLACDLRVADHVRFWGWQSPAQHFYEMMDIVLIPSHTEGLPNVALEAMALGVPVCATDVGGVSKLLKNGRCGVVLSSEEATWTTHIEPLIVSKPRRHALADAARRRIEKRYAFSHRMETMMSVYDRVLSVRGKPTLQRREAA